MDGKLRQCQIAIKGLHRHESDNHQYEKQDGEEGKKDEKGYWFPRLKSKDAIIVKFADRLSNLSRMDVWDEERQQHYLKKSKFWRSEP